MKAFFVILLLVLFINNTFCNASEKVINENRICSRLSNEGFENVAVLIEKETIYITLENRIYRNESEGIIKAIDHIVEFLSKTNKLILITQKYGIPFLKINMVVEDYINFKIGKISINDFLNSFDISICNSESEKIHSIEKVNRTSGKFELVIEPQIKFMFGDYAAPFKNKLDILPSLEASLWKGMNAKFQFVLPLWNYDYSEKYDYSRFGLFTINQTFRLPWKFFSNFTLGYFTQNQYGYEFEIGKYLLNGSLFLQANYGKTGVLSYVKNGYSGFYNDFYKESTIEFTDMYYNSWNASIEFTEKKYNLHVNIAYGKFLYEMKSWEINVFRQFNEVKLGLRSLLMDGGGKNFGFNICIPLYPRKYAGNQVFRLRTSEYISYSYLATQDIIYKYETQNRHNDIYGLINPITIKNQIVDYLKKIRIFTTD
ncbi:MAG: hypothetical protein HN704_05990 [Bacteroidetes bacterium]|jgi:hypothetical protein|nr:hypothetical protein [Bacteroidota bacterium]MBT6687286.1 hypothetical protein [Bacteroidota bacterium]MBT7143950.1 hypothetical protein [Bacteroidota bacterium]MBT7491137.1 hypothetical protein [Bacteroidota bacterium]